MRSALLYLLAIVMFATIGAVAWFTRAAEQPVPYTVTADETVDAIAGRAGLTVGQLARLNGVDVGELQPEPGDVILVPRDPASGPSIWLVHAAGLGAEISGVLLSFWLAFVVGILPRGYRQQMLGIACALGLASYAATYAVGDAQVALTPQFLFAAIKDGFAWSAAFPMFAAAFGMRGRESEAPPRPRSEPEKGAGDSQA